ncbi:sensor histidine kinase [Salininema proteolyticum]|uniref:histidine kinase n=1 Tax=Salininema proteolyticum TaxID=1607685 RepID=A0ABV8TU29_9ACTN
MPDTHPTPRHGPPTWRRALAAALAGILVGCVVLWTGDQSPVVMAVLATLGGVGAVLSRLSLPTVTVGVASMLITSTFVGQFAWSDSIVGLMTGTFYGFCFLAASLVAALVRARKSYVRRAWDLAFAEARDHDSQVERAVAREREAMAGEIHDGMGHRLTLIAVQAARLSLDEDLPPQARAELQRIRENAASAAEELGETVRLLGQRDSSVTASLSGLRIDDVVERALASGVAVRSAVEPGLEDSVNDYTHAALLRTLQEALTNAAKHAPGAEVRVEAKRAGERVRLTVSNAVSPRGASSDPTGHGLVALRHRTTLLGGTLEVDRGEVFALTVELPREAVPTDDAADRESSRVDRLAAEATEAEHGRRKETRQAWLVPLAMVAILVFVTGGYFVYANLTSVLPPEEFESISVGDGEGETVRKLPPSEMLDAPRSLVPEPEGAECKYYEDELSFFKRVDVYRVCFADGAVVATDRVFS